MLSAIERNQSALVAQLNTLIGVPFTVGAIETAFHGLTPQIVVRQIVVPSSGQALIRLEEIRVELNLFTWLGTQDLLSSASVTIAGAELTVRRLLDGSMIVVGLPSSEGQPLWLLQGRQYRLLHSRVTWIDEHQPQLPLRFDEVDLAINNQGEQHRFSASLQLPETIGQRLTVTADIHGDLVKADAWRGRLYMNMHGLSLPGLTGYLTASGLQSLIDVADPRWSGLTVAQGSADWQLWTDWQNAQLYSADLAAQFHDLALDKNRQQQLLIEQLATNLHGERTLDRQWRLVVNELSMTTRDTANVGKQWPSAVFSVSGQYDEQRALSQLALYVKQLDLQQLALLMQFFQPLPAELQTMITEAKPKGELADFSLLVNNSTHSLAMNGQFADLSIAPIDTIPGIEHLSGRLQGTDQQGSLSLSAHGAQLLAPKLFRENLPIDRLSGTVNWQLANAIWTLTSPLIELDSRSMQTQTQFQLSIPQNSEPVAMDLKTHFVIGDATQARHYLPVTIMSKNLVNWLDKAFIAGQATDGELLLSGKLQDFPFKQAPGIFKVVFHAQRMNLLYAPQWPQLADMDGDIEFVGNQFTANIQQGRSDEVSIRQAKVSIPDLNNGKQLLIQGEAESGIGQALTFMQHTPLRSPVDALLSAISLPPGNTQLSLDLKIPLVTDAETVVNGVADLQGASLKVKSMDLPVTGINGQLHFDEKGVFSDGLHASALGHPIAITIKSLADRTVVNVSGKVGVDDLQKQFVMPWWQLAQGESDYQLSLDLPYGDMSPSLLINSQLSGVAIRLPESLAKTAQQTVPLSVKFDLSGDQLLPMELQYGEQLKAALQLDTRQRNLYAGEVLIGKGELKAPGQPGVGLSIRRDRLDLTDWLVAASAQQSSAAVRQLQIQTEHALWHEQDLGRFDLSLTHQGQNWTGHVASPIIVGQVQLPDAGSAGRMDLALEQLDLSGLKRMSNPSANSQSTVLPTDMPLLTVSSHKTWWEGLDLGRLSLTTVAVDGGMGFKQLSLMGDQLQLTASGDWRVMVGNADVGPQRSLTRIQGHLQVPKVGPLLTQLDISRDITEANADVDFSLNWNGSPHQFSWANAQGQVDARFNNGRILSIEPGFGRILGMLALAQWIKRAQLDFSDIYQEGLTFNTIQGHFDLASGLATTQNLLIDAIPAKIAVMGNSHLLTKTLDYTVNVTPKSADAVPIAGTIMGKVANLLGRSLTGKDQEGFFFGSQYRVKGIWGSAEIIPVHKNDGLLPKTWHGIADFPWLGQPETP